MCFCIYCVAYKWVVMTICNDNRDNFIFPFQERMIFHQYTVHPAHLSPLHSISFQPMHVQISSRTDIVAGISWHATICNVTGRHQSRPMRPWRLSFTHAALTAVYSTPFASIAAVKCKYFWVAPEKAESKRATLADTLGSQSVSATHIHSHTYACMLGDRLHFTFQVAPHIKSAHLTCSGRQNCLL